jgi:hypothetical protein
MIVPLSKDYVELFVFMFRMVSLSNAAFLMVETRIDTMDVEVILLAIQREQRGDPKNDVLRRLKKLFNQRLL